MVHKCVSDFIRDSKSSNTTSSSITSSPNTTTTTYSYVFLLLVHKHVAAVQGCDIPPCSNGSESAVGKLHIYASKLDWLVGWLWLLVLLQWQVICQFSRHFKHSMSYIWNIHVWQILIFEWIILHDVCDACDGLYDFFCEENVKTIRSIDQQSMCI